MQAKETPVSNKSISEIKNIINEANIESIFVYAHADRENGILHKGTINGTRRIEEWHNEDVKIVQMSKGKSNLEGFYKNVFIDKDPAFYREIAYIVASDCRSINRKDKNEISIIQDTKEHVNQDTTKKRKIVTLTGFEGIFVNSYEIDVNNRIKEFFKKYGLIYETSITILYESFLNKKENFSNMRLKIEDAGLIIKKLYGNNGIIDENEYKRVNLSDNEVKKRYWQIY